MQYIVDILLVLVFGVIVAFAAKKGFFMTLFELAAYILSFVGAKVFSVSLAPVVYDNCFAATIRSAVENQLGDVSAKNAAKQIEAALEKIPEQLNAVMQLVGIDKETIMQKVSKADLSGKNVINGVMNEIVSPIATAIIQTLLFIILVFVLSLVLRLIIKLLDKFIKKLPVINTVNSGLGAFLGVIKGLIVMTILALIIGSLAGITKSETFVDSVNDSLIINSIRGIFTSISGYKM